jgi:hypothetical protein
MTCQQGSFTYDHRTLKIRLPVRSAIYKQCTGGLVVRWVTTSESPLLYVFVFARVWSVQIVTCASVFCSLGVDRRGTRRQGAGSCSPCVPGVRLQMLNQIGHS